MKLKLYHVFVYFGTFMVYASLHALRAGWSYSKADVSSQLNVSKQYLGVVDALYLVSYSAGMVILGSFIHRFSLKTYVIVGLNISCISYMIWMVIYGITGFFNVVIMTILMMVNGFFQATGWPGIMGIFSNWFVGHKKGVLMGLWSCSANAGDIIASAFLNLLDDHNVPFVWNFVLTGSIGIIVALVLLLFLKQKPDIVDQEDVLSEAKSSMIEQQKGSNEEINESQEKSLEDNQTKKSIQFKYGIFSALLIPRVPNYVFAYACLKGCMYGLVFWLPTLFDAHQGPVSEQKGYLTAVFDVGAVVGALAAGFLSDRFDVKALLLSPFLLCCAVTMFIISFALGNTVGPYYVTLFLAGFFISGPYNIIGTVIAIDIGSRIKEKGGVTKVSSLIEAAAAIFAMVEMVIIPHLQQAVVFYVFTGEMIIAAVVLIPVLINEWRSIKQKRDLKEKLQETSVQ